VGPESILNAAFKGVVHFKKKKKHVLIIYTPPCHPRCPCLSFFSRKEIKDFLHIMDFNGNQTVQGPNVSFSAASRGFKPHQTMNKGLI